MNIQHFTRIPLALVATLFGGKLALDMRNTTQKPGPVVDAGKTAIATAGRRDLPEDMKLAIQAEMRLEGKRIDIARGLLKEGNIAAATSTLNNYLAQFPTGYLRKLALVVLADAELRRNKFEDAATSLELADHMDPDVRAMTGLIKAIRGQLPAAERDAYKNRLCDLELDEIRPFLPSSESEATMIAGWYLLVGRELGTDDYQAASFYLEQALRLCPNNPAILICLSDANWAEGLRPRALTLMRRAVPQLTGDIKSLYAGQLRDREYIVQGQ
jgi:tetratricopeptide (TPR) repeat protein